MIYEIVDERLPRIHPIIARQCDPDCGLNIHWEKVDQENHSPDQRQAFILQKVGEFIGWGRVTYEYPVFDDPHRHNIESSAFYARELFLESKAYQAWKTRKTRGPGLFCVTGSGVSALFL